MVEVDKALHLVLDPAERRGGAIRQAPVTEHLLGVIIGRRADQHRRLADLPGHLRELLVGGNGVERPEGEVGGVGDAVGCGPAGFPVLVIDAQAVRLVVVMAQVHRARLGRPEPDLHFSGGLRAVGHFDRGGIFLPEALQAGGDAAGNVGHDGETERAVAVGHVQPGALGIGALLDREAVRPELRELGVAPDRDTQDAGARLLIEVREIRHALPAEMLGVEVGDLRAGLRAIAR